MATINIDSIMEKVRAFAKSDEGKKRIKGRIDDYRRRGVRKTVGDGTILTIAEMGEAAKTLIRIMREHANASNLPESVLKHFDSLTYRPPRLVGGRGSEKYEIEIFFTDDLSRMSLEIVKRRNHTMVHTNERTGDGVENIVSLFDAGYQAEKRVYGAWDGHGDGVYPSVTERDGKYFIEKAVSEFNEVWGEQYNAVASISTEDGFYSALNV